jgi:hypothetical protein
MLQQQFSDFRTIKQNATPCCRQSGGMNKTRNEPGDAVPKLGAFLEWELTPIKTPFAL